MCSQCIILSLLFYDILPCFGVDTEDCLLNDHLPELALGRVCPTLLQTSPQGLLWGNRRARETQQLLVESLARAFVYHLCVSREQHPPWGGTPKTSLSLSVVLLPTPQTPLGPCGHGPAGFGLLHEAGRPEGEGRRAP